MAMRMPQEPSPVRELGPDESQLYLDRKAEIAGYPTIAAFADAYKAGKVDLSRWEVSHLLVLTGLA